MQIRFKLFASLTDYLPPERRGNVVELEIPPESTVDGLVARFNLPRAHVHLVLINGVYVPPAERAVRLLQAGDVLAIWPPVAGG